jgi:excisionase family DNA binding protein
MIPNRIPATDRLLFGRRECASMLGVSERTLTYAIAYNKLNVVRIGRRTLIHRDELLRFAKKDQPNFSLLAA